MAKNKQPDKNEHVVIAFFPDQPAADKAADALQRWDDADDEIKLGAFGLLAMMDGKIMARRGRKTGKGAGVGAIMGVIAGVLTDFVTLGGLIGGGASTGPIGAFLKDSLHMTKAEIEKLAPELSAGKVALVVTCDDYEVEPTQAQLNSLGGNVRGYPVPSTALAAAVAAGVGDDWPTEPFEPEPYEIESIAPEANETGPNESEANESGAIESEPFERESIAPAVVASAVIASAAIDSEPSESDSIAPAAIASAAVASSVIDSEPFEPEPTPVPEVAAAAIAERTAALPEFTAVASTTAATGPTTVSADDPAAAESRLGGETF